MASLTRPAIVLSKSTCFIASGRTDLLKKLSPFNVRRKGCCPEADRKSSHDVTESLATFDGLIDFTMKGFSYLLEGLDSIHLEAVTLGVKLPYACSETTGSVFMKSD
jgi:hypothetical protein